MRETKEKSIMQFFEYEHLPLVLQEVCTTICKAAQELNEKLPECEEKDEGLRKLLEAKDCFVRARHFR